MLDAYAAEQTGLSHMTKFASMSPHVGEGVLIRKVSC